MSSPLISVDAITVRLRDRWLLGGSSWRINTGEQWAVVGPNGAGKTTLAKAVAGLLPVVQGTIRYHAFGDLPPTRAVAYVASDARRELWCRERQLNQARGFAGRFDDVTTVGDWLAGPHSTFVRADGRAVFPDDIAAHMGLHLLLDKPLLDISTGEMSRVLLARELIRRPKLLILDEPFEGLDESGRREMAAVLDGLAAAGLPMVLIVHRTEERLAATTHVLALDDGRIVAAGPVNHGPAPDGSGPWDADRPVTIPQPPVRLPAHSPADRCEVLIDMRTVTVRYGDAIALNHLSWTVRDGEHWAVTGPNGAGKSTLLKLITGDCLQVYANRIRLFGQARGAGQTLASVRRRLGVVSHELASGYQAGGNRRGASVLDTVCSGFFDSVGLYRHCTGAQRAVASGWLDRLGMASLAHAVFDRLSQGQRQMVLIARAMVKSPQLLILDEPCSGLDAANRRTVLNLVESIGRGGGTGLIFVTHHEPEIPDCITHRLRLDNGQRVGRGAVDAT